MPKPTIIDPQVTQGQTAVKVTSFKSDDVKKSLAGTRLRMAIASVLANYFGKDREVQRDQILAGINLVDNSPLADSDERTTLSIRWRGGKGGKTRDPQLLEAMLRKKKALKAATTPMRVVDEAKLNALIASGKITLTDLEACTIPAPPTKVVETTFCDPNDQELVIANIEKLISLMLDPKYQDKVINMIVQDPNVLIQLA